MVEISDDSLRFTFPEVHRNATLEISFQRTLRIPDDGGVYPLPPGLGCFPLRHVDDFANRVPGKWIEAGGVMLPMYQSEALWIHFQSQGAYPFAVKIATGKINAVTGEPWRQSLNRDPQDYLSIPEQPWLDGYFAGPGVIRQFVAMPLGSGYSVEEQLTGKSEHGGIQILVHPLKREAYTERESRLWLSLSAAGIGTSVREMSLAPGGRMRQKIYEDSQEFADWDMEHSGRCFVHIANSLLWRSISGSPPPSVPFTAEEYTRAGLPWFEYYSEGAKALGGTSKLSSARSVLEMGRLKSEHPLPENESVEPELVLKLGAAHVKN